MIKISYQNYRGGVNNLIIAEDTQGNRATSLKSIEQARINLKQAARRKERRREEEKESN